MMYFDKEICLDKFKFSSPRCCDIVMNSANNDTHHITIMTRSEENFRTEMLFVMI